MSRAWMMAVLASAVAGCASAPRVPERDLSQVRVGMSEADVTAVWGRARSMYKIDKTGSGCVERHVFGLVAGAARRPANIDFDAQRRVCAVGAVDVISTEAPLLAAEITPAPVVAVVVVAAPLPPPPDDVVLLKNGKQIRGKVTEGPAKGTVTIMMSDGTIKMIGRAKIKRVEKGG